MYVLFFGVVRGGSRRWIDLGPLNLQPSEFAKATLALVLAKFFGESRRGAMTRGDLLIAGGDYGACRCCSSRSSPTSARRSRCCPCCSRWRIVAGMPMRIFGILAVVGAAAAPIAWKFALQDYQKERISTFLNPSQDARGAGYQQIQARITVGSGGLCGKGSRRERRASCGSSPWHTMTSSSRCWPRSMGSWASSWRSGCICS